MKKRLTLVILVITMIFAFVVPVQAKTPKRINRKETIKILEPDEITTKILTHRKNKYILIEVIYGRVKNNKKDGVVLNTKSKKFNYISYKGVKGAKKGKKILTYLVYDNTNGEDTIEFRIDRVLN